MKPEENPRENELDEIEPLPIVIRRLDKVETTGFPQSIGNSN